MKFTDVLLETATKVLVFIILAFSIYVLFSGHHNPGGGFIGGLITASAIVLMYLTFDVRTVREALPIDFKLVGAAGVLIAVLTGLGALVFGAPFLKQAYFHIPLPGAGDIEIATAVIFDLGVYLAVIGTTMTIITSISEDE